MKLLKNKVFKKAVSIFAIFIVTIPLVQLVPAGSAQAQLPLLDPNLVRSATQQMGLDSLSKYILTDPPELLTYVNSVTPVADTATNPVTNAPPAALVTYANAHNLTVPRAALLILGKALFWDQQVGSDGQACASCHFQAGADNRVVNVLNPGASNSVAAERTKWGTTNSGATAAPNYTITAADFPFHELADPLETNYMKRDILFDTDDVLGSQGSFHATFTGSPAPVYATASAQGTYDSFTAITDPVFRAGTPTVKNTRSVGGRQAGSTINAVFSFQQFWDGRASSVFNGVNPLGPLDPNALIWTTSGSVLTQVACIVSNSSLASQSTGPPNSVFSDEMAFAGRTFPDIGRKLLRLTVTATTPTATIIPLGAQTVSATDSVLGTFKNAAGTNGGRGLNVTYKDLITWAFQSIYWDSAGVDAVTGLPITLTTPQGFHLMEANMSLFWGLAIQDYETTLRADQSPYDKFMSGDNSAFDPAGGPNSQKSQDAMRGMLTYIHTENSGQQPNAIFNNINFGACQLCHSGQTLTEMDPLNVAAKFFIFTDMTVKMDHNRELAIVPSASSFDVGFTNVGSRPTWEDIAHGGTAPNGWPLSYWRQLLTGLALPPGPFLPIGIPAPNVDRGSNTDGAFKIPHVRNIELTGPYFHNGGTLTLKQAVEFYARHGDFSDVNDPDIDVGLAMVQNIGDADANFLVSFLLSLTDERVRWEQAPFDHPSLVIPNGHPVSGNHPKLGASYLPDNYITLPAVGAAGRSALPAPNNTPLPAFLGISSTPVAGLNNDQFDP